MTVEQHDRDNMEESEDLDKREVKIWDSTSPLGFRLFLFRVISFINNWIVSISCLAAPFLSTSFGSPSQDRNEAPSESRS